MREVYVPGYTTLLLYVTMLCNLVLMETKYSITTTAPLDTDRQSITRITRRVWEDQIGDPDTANRAAYESLGHQIVAISDAGRFVPDRFHESARIISRLCPLAEVVTEESWRDDGFGGERTIYVAGQARKRFVIGWVEVPV